MQAVEISCCDRGGRGKGAGHVHVYFADPGIAALERWRRHLSGQLIVTA